MDTSYWVAPVVAVLVMSLILAGAYATRPPRAKNQRRDF
jgi:hypothetical protein